MAKKRAAERPGADVTPQTLGGGKYRSPPRRTDLHPPVLQLWRAVVLSPPVSGARPRAPGLPCPRRRRTFPYAPLEAQDPAPVSVNFEPLNPEP